VIDVKTFNVDMLPPLKSFTGADVVALRDDLGVSRPVFAMLFNVSVSAVRKWEGREDSALSGGDLVLANQLAAKGLTGYLNGSAGESSKLLTEAAYGLLAGLEIKRNAIVVSPEAVEGLKGALGLRSETGDSGRVIRKVRARAVGHFAEELGLAIRDAESVADVEQALKALVLLWAVEI
jgi:DNA-binding transcriptional regulator YiaG